MTDGGAPANRTRACDLQTIAEFERLLGFHSGARLLLKAVEHCRASPRGCQSPYHCLGRAAQGDQAAPSVVLRPRPARPPRRQRNGTGVVIPFAAAAHCETSCDAAGNFVERRAISTDVALARGDSLATLLRYWRALAGSDRLPRFGDIDPVRLSQIGVLGFVHVVNAAHPDPSRMRFDLYGNRIPLDNGRSYAGLAIGDYPIAICAQSVIEDYETARGAERPHFGRIRMRLSGVNYRYVRLILPFTTNGRRVDRLVVATRTEQQPSIELAGPIRPARVTG